MKVEQKFRVCAQNVDKFNKIKISAIMNYFQELATLHSDSAKDGIYYMDKNNGAWVVINWRMKMYSSLKWNEEFTVTTWSRKFEKIYAYRDYKMCNQKGELVAIASSRWIYFDFKTNSIKNPPMDVIERYQSEDVMIFGTDDFKKLKEHENQELIYTYAIQKKDIDWNNHVNNVVYVDMIQEVLDENARIEEIEILYKKECKYGANVNVYCAKVSDKEMFFSLKDKETGTLHVVAHVTLDLYQERIN
ncbi:MAG: thioesterase [Oscillospiraceae bacterium]|nr:thioesterase [Oscillospiraceae bacterium]